MAQLPQQLDTDSVEPQGESQRADACRVSVHVSGTFGSAWCVTHDLDVAFAFGRSVRRGLAAQTTCLVGRN